MKITSLNIKNFRGIKNANFSFHNRLNIFIGDNGVGKSAILNCMAILLSKMTYRLLYQKNNGRIFTGGDISHCEKYTKKRVNYYNR